MKKFLNRMINKRVGCVQLQEPVKVNIYRISTYLIHFVVPMSLKYTKIFALLGHYAA